MRWQLPQQERVLTAAAWGAAPARVPTACATLTSSPTSKASGPGPVPNVALLPAHTLHKQTFDPPAR